MSEYIYGLPNPEIDREMYEDPGMALYMSNRISAMENEYEEYSIPNTNTFNETIDKQLETMFGLEGDRFTGGFIKFFKFLKDNIMKFLNFIFDFIMRLFRNSLDIRAYYRKIVIIVGEIKMSLAYGGDREDSVSIHNSIYRVRYALIGLLQTWFFVRIAFELSERDYGPGNEIQLPYHLLYLLVVFPDFLKKIPEDETSKYAEEVHDDIEGVIERGSSIFDEELDRNNIALNSTKDQIVSLIKKYTTKLKSIDTPLEELNLEELMKHHAVVHEDIVRMNLTLNGKGVFDFGKNFKKIDKIRKKAMSLFKDIKSPEDLSEKIGEGILTDNKEAYHKLIKVMAESSVSIAEIKNMTGVAVKSFVEDMDRYVAEVKVYTKK